MTDWNTFAERCLLSEKSHDSSDDELKAISGDLCLALMPRDDYPSVAVRVDSAVRLGNVSAAIELIEHLFPGWGYQVGRPLTVRSPCGWYASVFRERRSAELRGPLAGMFTQDGRTDTGRARYANSPSMALMAALCRVLAAEQPGASAIAA